MELDFRREFRSDFHEATPDFLATNWASGVVLEPLQEARQMEVVSAFQVDKVLELLVANAAVFFGFLIAHLAQELPNVSLPNQRRDNLPELGADVYDDSQKTDHADRDPDVVPIVVVVRNRQKEQTQDSGPNHLFSAKGSSEITNTRSK